MRTYGRVALSQRDIATITQSLESSLEAISTVSPHAQSDGERRFYGNQTAAIQRLLGRFRSLKPGPTPFLEADLILVIGSVSHRTRASLFERWQQERLSAPEGIQEVSQALDEVDDLLDRLHKPGLDDTNLDPEPDED